ncbi:MAG: hypothetical protein R6U25_00715 [Alkalispirochaeta sp.]
MNRLTHGIQANLLFLVRLFLVAVGINFVWEMAQMPLYENMPFDSAYAWWLCFRASLGDGVIIVFIWAVGWVVFRGSSWFRPLRAANIAVLLFTGAVIAVAIELHALGTGRWAYTGLMPIVPVAEVGLSPLIQLLILPWISMVVAKRYRVMQGDPAQS